MHYIDPYELFSIADPAQVDEDLLRKLRRRMMAEFELSNDGFLDWRGHAVDKTAATELLDAIADPQVREHYWAMRQVPGLVAYLTDDDPLFITQIQWPASELQPDFHLFVSGFLAAQFNQQLGWAMENAQWPEALMLLDHIHLLAPATLDPAFKTATRWVHAGIIAMEEAVHNHLTWVEEFDARPYVQSGLVKTLNKFPSALAYLRNTYAAAMLALAQMYANDDKLKTSIQVITLVCRLDLDEMQMRRCVEFKRDVLERQHQIDHPGLEALGSYSKANESTRQIIKALAIAGVIAFALISLFSDPNISRMFRDRPAPRYMPNPPARSSISDLSATSEKTKSEKINAAVSGDNVVNPLYESLRAQVAAYPDKDPKKSAPLHENGWNPYRGILGDIAVGKQDGKTAEFTFRNENDGDLVLFLEQGDSAQIVASYYVKGKASLYNREVPVGFYTLRIFNGEEWRDSIGTFKGKPIGGFTQQVEFIGCYKTEFAPAYASAPAFKVGIARDELIPMEIVYRLHVVSLRPK